MPISQRREAKIKDASKNSSQESESKDDCSEEGYIEPDLIEFKPER